MLCGQLGCQWNATSSCLKISDLRYQHTEYAHNLYILIFSTEYSSRLPAGYVMYCIARHRFRFIKSFIDVKLDRCPRRVSEAPSFIMAVGAPI